MFSGTVTALKTREHQRDGNSEADFRRQERSHPGSKWGQLGHRCFQPPPLLSLKVFYTALGLRCRKLYVYTTAHQTAVNRMMGFFLVGKCPIDTKSKYFVETCPFLAGKYQTKPLGCCCCHQ